MAKPKSSSSGPRKTFTSEPRTHEAVEFDLDGDTYHLTPPKIAPMLMSVASATDGGRDIEAVRQQLAWFETGLPEEEFERLIDRLEDYEDGLDLSMIGQVFRWVVEQTTGRPMPPSSG